MYLCVNLTRPSYYTLLLSGAWACRTDMIPRDPVRPRYWDVADNDVSRRDSQIDDSTQWYREIHLRCSIEHKTGEIAGKVAIMWSKCSRERWWWREGRLGEWAGGAHNPCAITWWSPRYVEHNLYCWPRDTIMFPYPSTPCFQYPILHDKLRVSCIFLPYSRCIL